MNLRQLTNVKKPGAVAVWSLIVGATLIFSHIGIHG